MVQITPRVIPDGYEFLACLTQNTEWTPPEDGFYRITCIGASSSGVGGTDGYRENNPADPVVGTWSHTNYGGHGGAGGGAGGISRSILDLKVTNPVHCTVTSSIVSFGEHLSATGGSGKNGGVGSGGTDINTTGNSGGNGGEGAYDYYRSGDKLPGCVDRWAKDGGQGGGNGALGGISAKRADYDNGVPYAYESGGGGGGGGTYALPDNISYDDPLYTTYIKRSLTEYRAGNGAKGRNAAAVSGMSYPSFNPLTPVWYGGGNGGGGGSVSGRFVSGAAGSAGSPGGILIEKGVFH